MRVVDQADHGGRGGRHAKRGERAAWSAALVCVDARSVRCRRCSPPCRVRSGRLVRPRAGDCHVCRRIGCRSRIEASRQAVDLFCEIRRQLGAQRTPALSPCCSPSRVTGAPAGDAIVSLSRPSHRATVRFAPSHARERHECRARKSRRSDAQVGTRGERGEAARLWQEVAHPLVGRPGRSPTSLDFGS